MNLVLYTANDCNICHQAEEAFRKAYKEEIAKGEAEVVNLDEDEDAQELWAENELPLAPVMIVVSDQRKVITVLDPGELVNEASTAAREAER